MTVTEKVAATKWCPLIDRNAYLQEFTQRLDRDDGAKCIGSHCMAWRWGNAKDMNSRVGYCGAFGKVEP